jgi:hypothetical protein
MIILDQLELITAFCSSFILLAACLEHNGMIRKPIGKVLILLVSIFPIYYLISTDTETLEDIEDLVIFRWGEMQTDLFRFLYGFVLPLIAIIILIGVFFYYYYNTKMGNINFNPKVMRSTIILCLLIFIFSIFEGFDYYEDTDVEIIFIGLRGITLAFFIIIPLLVIFSHNLGLQKFLIIKHSGLPLFQYDFLNRSVISDYDDISFLSSGFVTAIVSCSERLANRETGFLSMQSRYLYYIIVKTKARLYALQSVLSNKKLETQLFKIVEEIENFSSNIDKVSNENLIHFKEILETNLSSFL